ncbi:DUF6503 family protein [Mariniflexile litorale]|uniref:DUF6503 family protein n=1 Tax=Mariniflexile litorale TaxID=3045158 RepID=A0AAU7EEK5_9FLAO|nr:DUF6503 family protein [Mariniflexile sp. KMM 9835]MDQ8212293.1 hypothetical protein [Mariniflexile sp. KMM 9835]
MKIQPAILVLIGTATLLACNQKKNKTEIAIPETAPTTETVTTPQATLIVNKAMDAHGGALYDSAHYEFVFRGDTYHFKNMGKQYEYSKTFKKEGVLTKDVLKNGSFYRLVNGDTLTLPPKVITSATGAINSVIYFATLPHKLGDDAVIKTYLGNTQIKGEKYNMIGVTFKKEGGGADFDDAYCYWIHTETHLVDYLAYNYHVNKGGVRFRSAYNRSVVDGITFQDYVNYEAEVGTSLIDLPQLYEAGKLNPLSKIETEAIINLKNN